MGDGAKEKLPKDFFAGETTDKVTGSKSAQDSTEEPMQEAVLELEPEPVEEVKPEPVHESKPMSEGVGNAEAAPDPEPVQEHDEL